LFAGAVQLKPTCAFPGVVPKPVGASGTAYGVAEFEADEALPVPAAFVAVIVNV
jgi:hypothetical protein